MDFITDRYKVVLASKSPRRQALLKEIVPEYKSNNSIYDGHYAGSDGLIYREL